jgi:hypothetical protein
VSGKDEPEVDITDGWMPQFASTRHAAGWSDGRDNREMFDSMGEAIEFIDSAWGQWLTGTLAVPEKRQARVIRRIRVTASLDREVFLKETVVTA